MSVKDGTRDPENLTPGGAPERDAIAARPGGGHNAVAWSVPPDNTRLAAEALARWEGEGGMVRIPSNRHTPAT